MVEIKMYILHKDGFGDLYQATPEEEAICAQEVVSKINNNTCLLPVSMRVHYKLQVM